MAPPSVVLVDSSSEVPRLHAGSDPSIACCISEQEVGIGSLKEEATLVRRLNDDLAGLKKDFQGDFTVIMPLNVFGTKLLERRDNPWQK